MALTMHQKKAVTKELAGRYRRATKREKRLILDEFVAVTGYNRSYAAWALRNSPKPGQPVRKKPVHPRTRKYGTEEFKALRKIWAVLSGALWQAAGSLHGGDHRSAGKMR